MRFSRSFAGALLILSGASLVAGSLSFSPPMFADEHTGVYQGKECGPTKLDCEQVTNDCEEEDKCWSCGGARSRHFCKTCDPFNEDAICELSDITDCEDQMWRPCDADGACDTSAVWTSTTIKCTIRFPGRQPNKCQNIAGCTAPH